MRTKILRIQKGNDGNEYVEFHAQRDSRFNWSAPLWLVENHIGPENIRPDVEVDLEFGPHRSDSNKQMITHIQFVAGPQRAENATQSRLPYGFVPIDIDKTVLDTPVWHDGSEAQDLLSGEVRCTLTALTPLLPGNYRYALGLVDGKFCLHKADNEKQVAEPIRLRDGRVLIPGTSLKGMLRHSLGALLSAPMERVGERRYSYRPNLHVNPGGTKEQYVVRPALIVAGTLNGGWEIDVFDNARAAIFVRHDAVQAVQAAAKASACGLERIPGVQREIKVRYKNGQEIQRETNHLIPDLDGTLALKLPMTLVDYRGGIDGLGYLAAAFKVKTKNGEELSPCGTKIIPKGGRADGPFVYAHALVPSKEDRRLSIPAAVYNRFLEDQKEALSNITEGHLGAHPLEFEQKKVREAILSNGFSRNQLVYVELKTDADGKVTKDSDVVSCGQHFFYRWAYTSSVRQKDGETRSYLAPHRKELESGADSSKPSSPDQPPAQLSGARLMFGYVKTKETAIGRGAYEQLAGRVAINHGLSEKSPKFLGSATSDTVPLKILGQPKTSAWEFYLEQGSEGQLKTYGDLPGDPGGELRGRKFYRHWLRCDEAAITETDETLVKSRQAALARYICAKGTQFRFTLRFAGLRRWELGAVLATLKPGLLADKEEGVSGYAHKLGLGRPLGMGSVAIEIDRILCRSAQEIELRPLEPADRVTAINELKERLDAGNTRKWLQAHSYIEGAAPPRYPEKGGNIYGWHTDIRRDYSKLRRQDIPDWKSLRNKIKQADPEPSPDPANDKPKK